MSSKFKFPKAGEAILECEDPLQFPSCAFEKRNYQSSFFFWSITFLLYMLMIAHHTGNYFKVNLFLKIVFVVDSFAATFFSHLTTSTSYSRWLKCLLSSHHMTNCGQPPTSSGQSERSPAFWKLTSQTLGLFSLNWTNPLCWKPSHVWEKGIRFWDITSFEGSTEGKNDYF